MNKIVLFGLFGLLFSIANIHVVLAQCDNKRFPELCFARDAMIQHLPCSSLAIQSPALPYCQALENLSSGKICQGLSPEAFVACYEIHRGLLKQDCKREPKMVPELCEFGHYLSDNYDHFYQDRKAFLERRILANTLQEMPPSPVESRIFKKDDCSPVRTNLYQETEDKTCQMAKVIPGLGPLCDHIKIQEIRDKSVNLAAQIGSELRKNSENPKISSRDLLSFSRELTLALESGKMELLEKSRAQNKIVYQGINSDLNGSRLPCAIDITPAGEIVAHLDKLRIKDKIINFEPLGEGSFKTVYLGVDYENSTSPVGVGGFQNSFFALAEMKQPDSEEERSEIEKEIQLQKNFEEEPGVVKTIFTHNLNKNFTLVQPYYPMTLNQYREHLHESARPIVEGQTVYQVEIDLSLQIARALSAIHKKMINHRDIKPDNILIKFNKNGIPEPSIADFGLSVDIHDEASISKHAGTIEYISPNYLNTKPARIANQDLKNDVWALGLTLYQLTHNTDLEFVDRKNQDILGQIKSIKSYRDLSAVYGIHFSPENPPEKNSLEHVIFRMLDPDNQTRPSSAEVVQMLQELKNSTRERDPWDEWESRLTVSLDQRGISDKLGRVAAQMVDPSQGLKKSIQERITQNLTVELAEINRGF